MLYSYHSISKTFSSPQNKILSIEQLVPVFLSLQSLATTNPLSISMDSEYFI